MPSPPLMPCSRALDLAEFEAGALGDADKGESAENVGALAALAVLAIGFGKQADRLVVADRRRSDSGSARDLADRQCRGSHPQLVPSGP